MNKVWFTADTHFSHKNILKYTHRPEVFGLDLESETFIEEHNQWLIDKWNSTVGKKDTVYILGDFSFANQEETKKILEKLHGIKHIVYGNHDMSARKLTNYFESCSDIKEVIFKKSTYPFLEEDFSVEMCHYPILSWNRRNYGSCMIHGHCHGNIDDINKASNELRVDVGIDGSLANYEFISLEDLYYYFKTITNGELFLDYVRQFRSL